MCERREGEENGDDEEENLAVDDDARVKPAATVLRGRAEATLPR